MKHIKKPVIQAQATFIIRQIADMLTAVPIVIDLDPPIHTAENGYTCGDPTCPCHDDDESKAQQKTPAQLYEEHLQDYQVRYQAYLSQIERLCARKVIRDDLLTAYNNDRAGTEAAHKVIDMASVVAAKIARRYVDADLEAYCKENE